LGFSALGLRISLLLRFCDLAMMASPSFVPLAHDGLRLEARLRDDDVIALR
jgi:hypothetical protein